MKARPAPVVPPPPVDVSPPGQEGLDLLQVVEGAGAEEEELLQGDGRLHDVAHHSHSQSVGGTALSGSYSRGGERACVEQSVVSSVAGRGANRFSHTDQTD